MHPSTPAGNPSQPGWHPDPWNRDQWRWWDGWTWTAHVTVKAKKPVLPAWLSIPVLIAALFVVPWLLSALFGNTLAFVLAMIPMIIVLPVMLWLDRVEPEPHSALVHAFLWGATVAVLVASIVNSIVSAIGGEVIAATFSAPLTEEAMKAGAILIAVRRRQLDGAMDGIVYAGWAAVGFAVVEDVEYFVRASEAGQLGAVFVLRGLLSPFAHPLFTAWTGLAIGRAVARGRPPFPAMLWGYGLAVLSHAVWNGSAAAAQHLGDFGMGVLLQTVIAFVALFFTFAAVLYRVRRKEERRFCQLVPWLAERYGLTPPEVALFGDFKAMLNARKRLAGPQRGWFDRVHAALARLAVLHDRPGGADAATEQFLVAKLQQARFGGGDE